MFTEPAVVFSILMLTLILVVVCGLFRLMQICAAFYHLFVMPSTGLTPPPPQHTQLYACPNPINGFPACRGLLLYLLNLVTLYREYLMIQ